MDLYIFYFFFSAHVRFEFANGKSAHSPQSTLIKPVSPGKQSPMKSKTKSSNAEILSPSKSSASNLTKHVHQNLLNEISGKWQNNDISAKVKAERKLELANLRNRFEHVSKVCLIIL